MTEKTAVSIARYVQQRAKDNSVTANRGAMSSRGDRGAC